MTPVLKVAVLGAAALLPLAGLPACSTGDPAGGPPAAAAVGPTPEGPLAPAARWVLDQFAGEGPPLTEAMVRERFAPEFLDTLMPPAAVVQAVEGTADEVGALHFAGYDFPPLERSLVAIVEGSDGFRGAVHLSVDDTGAITGLDLQEAPPPRPAEDADTGWFETEEGRQLYLHCSGSGPTVVLDGGVWSDWEPVRAELAAVPVTVCAFDRPGAFGSASTPVPTPRTGPAHLDDLRAALRQVGAPGPYVVVGHSNSGLFAQLWAVTRPGEVAGLVLVDPVTADYGERRVEALSEHLPPADLAGLRAQQEALPPVIVDPEQLDVPGTQALLRASWPDALDVPAVVLTHGRPAEHPPGWPVAVDEALWRDLHEDLADRFTDGRLVVVEGSGHDIHREDPSAVAHAVTTVVG